MDEMNTDQPIRLTRTVKGAGCAAKLAPGDLERALCGLDLPVDDNLLVGLERADDAGVYRISDDLALVQTLDFFPPMVDDPYAFGRIVAAEDAAELLKALCQRGVDGSAIIGEVVKEPQEMIEVV